MKTFACGLRSLLILSAALRVRRFEVGKHSELLVRARDHEEQQRWIKVLDSEIKRLRGHGSSMPASTRPNTLSSSRPSMSSSTNSRVRPKEREFANAQPALLASARPISQMSGSSSSGSRPPTLGSPVKEGWMQKRGDINRAWRRRYFALYQVGHASSTHHTKTRTPNIA